MREWKPRLDCEENASSRLFSFGGLMLGLVSCECLYLFIDVATFLKACTCHTYSLEGYSDKVEY